MKFVRKKTLIWILIVLSALLFLLLVGSVIRQRYFSAEFQRKQALHFAAKGDYEQSIRHYERAIFLSDTPGKIRMELAEIYLQSDNQIGYFLQLSEVIASSDSAENDVEKAYQKLIDYYVRQENYTAITLLLDNCKNVDVLNANQKYLAKEPEYGTLEGTYTEVVLLKLTSNAMGTIYYTLDGSVPNENSSVYTAPIPLEIGAYTVSAFFLNEYGIKSDVVTKKYFIDIDKPAEPVVTPESGIYDSPQMITLSPQENCVIYYTSDGTIPGEHSTVYQGVIPMALGKSELRFVAYNKEGLASNVTNRLYELKIETPWTPEKCCEEVIGIMLKTGKILSPSGSIKDNKGKYKYEFSYALSIPEHGEFFIVNEVYEDTAGVRTGTGSYYAVNISSGDVLRFNVDKNGTYLLEEIDIK